MSSQHDSSNASPAMRPGWNRPQPEKLPEPTSWPAATALAVALIVWGLVSSLIITAVGAGLFILALAGWIGDILHERRQG
jgi:hypothetical protein